MKLDLIKVDIFKNIQKVGVSGIMPLIRDNEYTRSWYYLCMDLAIENNKTVPDISSFTGTFKSITYSTGFFDRLN